MALLPTIATSTTGTTSRGGTEEIITTRAEVASSSGSINAGVVSIEVIVVALELRTAILVIGALGLEVLAGGAIIVPVASTIAGGAHMVLGGNSFVPVVSTIAVGAHRVFCLDVNARGRESRRGVV